MLAFPLLLSGMAELIWDGKYDEHGNKRAPVRIELPFQTVETVNESGLLRGKCSRRFPKEYRAPDV